MKKYTVKYEARAVKQLSKLGHSVRKIIKKWIEKNLQETENPRQHGKLLLGDKNDYWRYRVGDYRILVEIRDEELLIITISIAHRKDVYKGK